MKLYHFCRAFDLYSIAEKGLCPHVPTEPVMSLGEEVVWLTSSETTATTADEDIEHYRRLGLWTEEEIDETWRHGWLLDTGRTHRLTVRVRSGSQASELWGLAAREWRRGDHRRKRDGTGQRCWRSYTRFATWRRHYRPER